MTFRFEKLTIKAQEAVVGAQNLASENGHPEFDALHLLATLLGEKEGVVKPVLDKIGANIGQLAQLVEGELGRMPKSSGGATPQPNTAMRKVLETAASEAATMKDEFVSTEHLLLALTKSDSKAKNLLKMQAVRDSDVLAAFRGDSQLSTWIYRLTVNASLTHLTKRSRRREVPDDGTATGTRWHHVKHSARARQSNLAQIERIAA